MKKLILVFLIGIALISFDNKHKEYYALIGNLNDFSVLKTALLKDSTTNNQLIQWVDRAVVKIQK